MTETNVVEATRFDRRKFLAGTGAMVCAVGVPRLLDPRAASAAVKDFPIGPAAVDPKQLDSWLAVKGDGTVVMKTGKEELGTGTLTETMQVVADELDVPFDRITSIVADTWHTVDQGTTSGSQTTLTEFSGSRGVGLRQAAAEVRAALLNLASQSLGVPASQLSVKDGVVSGGGKQVSYADLIGDKKFNLPITGKPKPKPYEDYKVVGTSVPRVDIPAKVFGSFTYNNDIKLPGMAYGRVVRPPTLGSKLVEIKGYPKRIPGLVRVFAKDNYVGVVAEREEQAALAASTLEVTWETKPLPSYSTFYDDLVAAPADTVQSRLLIDTKDVDAAIAKGSRQLQAVYKYPIQMHGPMGASTAVAWVQGKTATVWAHAQNVWNTRGMLATALGIPERNIRVIFTEASGVYGLTGAPGAALDAAILSQATGRPVSVQYTRADEHKWENYGQPYVSSMKAGLDDSGKVTGWSAESWTTRRGSRPGPPANIVPGILLGFPEDPFEAAALGTTPSSKPGEVDHSNSGPSYLFPSQRQISHRVKGTFMTGPLRSPNRIQNTFANESFIDELAYEAGQDPIAYRLQYLKDQRLIDVINAAAKLAKWQPRRAASQIGTGQKKTGRGISAMVYEGTNSWNALIVQATVDTKTGKVTIDHAWSAQDCGPVINPTGMRMQAEGGLMQGVSRSLIEELSWKKDGITSVDWKTYPVIRFDQMPKKFDFVAIDRKDEEATGAGEVLITNAPAAVANAIFDATGVRMRQVPFTPARVRAALKAAAQA